MNSTEVIARGYQDYMKGIPRTKNPFHINSSEYGLWLSGWFDGFDEEHE